MPAGTSNLTVFGGGFQEGALVLIEGQELEPEIISNSQLSIPMNKLSKPLIAGIQIDVSVKNQAVAAPLSYKYNVKII